MNPAQPQKYWGAICALLVFPLTAILHNLLTFPHECILRSFEAQDYYPRTLKDMLLYDTALPWSIIGAMLIYRWGAGYRLVRIAAWSFFLAFIPLTIWIWDIPMAGRYICHHFHDDRLVLWGTPVHTKHFYLLSASLFVLFFAFAARRAPGKATA